MSNTLFFRCEGTTLDGTHDHSTGDTTLTAVGAPAISATAARLGSNGILIDDSANEYYSLDSASIVTRTVGSFGCFFRFTTWLDGTSILKVIGASPSNRIQVTMGTTDELQFNIRLDGGTTTTLVTTAANLASNTWHRFIARYNQAANDMRLEVYDTSSSTPIHTVEDLATAYDVPDEVTTLIMGSYDNVGALGLHIDNVIWDSAYDGVTPEQLLYTSYTEFGGPANPVGPPSLIKEIVRHIGA